MPVPASEKALKRSKMLPSRSASMPRPVSRTVNCTKSLISSAASRISPSGGRVADRVGEQIIENGADGAAVGVDHGKIGEGADLDADVLLGGFVAIAVARLIEQRQGTEAFKMQFAFAGIELSHFNQVGHEVVQLFGLAAGGGHELGLQRLQIASEALCRARRGRGATAAADRAACGWPR